MSIFSQIKGSIGAMIFGFILIIGSICTLWWNEGRTIKNHKGLLQGASEVYSSQNTNYVSPENEGKLIHISGAVQTSEKLQDSDFGIEVQSLKFKRKVELFQWKENKQTKKKEGSDEKITTYSYEQEWSKKLHDSKKFNEPESHQNPNGIDYHSFSKAVSSAQLGAHQLNKNQIAELQNWAGFNFTETKAVENASLINSEGSRSTIYIGNSSLNNPVIGDYRITYKAVYEGDYSIIAKQVKNTFEPFTTHKGTDISMVNLGIQSAESMFQNAIDTNKTVKWLLRAGGFVLMFFGVRLLFSLITMFTGKIPILGSIVNFGISLFAGIVAFCISFITAGISWVFYRPVLGIILLLVGIGTLLFFSRKGKKMEKAI